MSTDDPIDGVPESPEPEQQQPVPDHPQSGVAAEGWSSPQSEPAGVESHCAEIVLKRGGAPTDIKYSVSPPAVIGRFDPSVGPIDVDLTSIPEGSYVSRKHASISYTDGLWKISDLGSSNGTFVLRDGDFQRVEESELNDGDEFALGNARFQFHVSESETCEA